MGKGNKILEVGSIYTSTFPFSIGKKAKEECPMKIYFMVDEISATLAEDEEWEDSETFNTDEKLRDNKGLLNEEKYNICIMWKTNIHASMDESEYVEVAKHIGNNFTKITKKSEKKLALKEIKTVSEANKILTEGKRIQTNE